MSWSELIGHDALVEQFRRSVARGRLASTFLFVGPPGVGKRTFALKLAQALLCETNPAEQLLACGRCDACRQAAAQTHPDLILVGRPKDRSFIPIETFIGDREHRMREGLCYTIGLKPFRGGRRIAIIDDADYLNVEGANCLLKTLEEPPPKSVIILIGTSIQRQLPTIRSRCQIVRFPPLPEQAVAELLRRHGLVEDAERCRSLARLSGGSITRAVELADGAIAECRGLLLERLADPLFDAAELVSPLASLIDEAGKDAAPRRQRMREAIAAAIEFYRTLIRRLEGAATAEGDAASHQAVEAAAARWRGGAASASACLQRCLDALAHIDANANQATLLEAWLDDLAEISRTGGPLRREGLLR